MTAPIEQLMDQVRWAECSPDSSTPGKAQSDIPFATHEGVLEIGEMKLRCYRLSNGQAVLHEDDMHKYFGEFLPPRSPPAAATGG